MSVVQEKFDLAAVTWDEKPERVAMAKIFAGEIQSSVPLNSNMKALEFGCGSGNLALALADHLGQVLAVDSSSKMVEVVANKIKAGEFENVEARCIDIFTEAFHSQYDLIYSALTMHHIEDTQRVLDKLAGLLNSGGYVVLIDLDKEDGSFHDDNSWIPHLGFERKALKNKLVKAGFELLAFEEVYRRSKEMGNGELKEFPMFMVVAKKP